MASGSATSTIRTGGSAGTVRGSARESRLKETVADQISQGVQSTSNLLHLMQQSSPSYAQLTKLLKSLLEKTSKINNTGQVLELMPRVISSLDAHTESGLQSVPHLKTAIQLLANMESCQLNSISEAHLPKKADNTHAYTTSITPPPPTRRHKQ